MSRDYPSDTARIVNALEEISALLENMRDRFDEQAAYGRDLWRHRVYVGGPDGAHHPWASTGEPGSQDAGSAEIVYGCFCRSCAYWRSRVQ